MPPTAAVTGRPELELEQLRLGASPTQPSLHRRMPRHCHHTLHVLDT